MAKILPRKDFTLRSSLVRPYKHSDDTTWAEEGEFYSPVDMWLTQRCVRSGKQVWVRNPNSWRWEEYPNKDVALSPMLNYWAGVQEIEDQKYLVAMDLIKEHLDRSIVAFDAPIYLPGAGDFIYVRGSKRFNTYYDSRAVGDDTHIEACREILLMMRNSLCAWGPEEPTVEEMRREIDACEGEFSWMVQYIAAKFQDPSFVPYTNLWLVGPQRGIGKGTLGALLRRLFGHEAVNRIEQKEIDNRGWGNALVGALWGEWDEVSHRDNYNDLGNVLKDKTGNEVISIAMRNIGTVEHLATACHLFTTNSLRPMRVEPNDRQNTFIRTTDDRQWATRVAALYDPRTGKLVNEAQIISGLSALLTMVRVDEPFVRKVLWTKLRQELIEGWIESWRQWVEDLEDGHPMLEEPHKLSEIHKQYYDDCKMMKRAAAGLREFTKDMRRAGYLRPARDNRSRMWVVERPPVKRSWEDDDDEQ